MSSFQRAQGSEKPLQTRLKHISWAKTDPQKTQKSHINHIANITIVDDYLNKREIKAQSPSKYMKKFQKINDDLELCMRTHLIGLKTFGVFEDDYDSFLTKRCKKFSVELKKRVIEQEIDRKESATKAEQTLEAEIM